jgi:hypothetical protein
LGTVKWFQSYTHATHLHTLQPPQRDSIDRALLVGDSYCHIASQFGTSTGALQRHKADHLPKTLVKAHEAQEVARADNLLAQVFRQEALFDELDQSAKVIQESAIGEKDRRGALDAISVRGNLSHKRRGYMELFGRITGELPDSDGAGVTVNLVRVLSVPRIGETLESFNAALAYQPNEPNALPCSVHPTDRLSRPVASDSPSFSREPLPASSAEICAGEDK